MNVFTFIVIVTEIFVNSVDRGDMLQLAASHHGPHCLHKFLKQVSGLKRVQK